MSKIFFILALLIAPNAFATEVTVASCDQVSAEAAIDAAGVNGTVVFPSCVYMVDNFQATLKQTWNMQGAATLKRTPTTTGPVLKLVADLTLQGGILDGARGVNLTPNVGVDSTGYAFTWSDGVMQNISSWGVAIDDGHVKLYRNKFTNIKNACVIWRNTTSITKEGPTIDGNKCDRSGEDPVSFTSGGIIIHAKAGKWMMNPRVINNYVLLPFVGSPEPYASVAIELGNTQHAMVMGNKTEGGRIGLSFSGSQYGIITGNVVQGGKDYAIELGDGSTNNNVQANNMTGYVPSRWGIISSQNSTNNKVIGNAMNGFTGVAPDGGCTGAGSNVCKYSGSSYSVDIGN